jgi:hypothetical protein
LVYFTNVLFIALFVPAVYIIEGLGMRFSLIIACALTIAGTWVSLLGKAIGIKIFGQLIIDAGFPLVIGCVTKITAAWFPCKERFMATSVIFMAGIGGYTAGDTSAEVFGLKTPKKYAICLTALLGVSIILLLALFKNKPEHYPSMSQVKKHYIRVNVVKDLQQMVSNRPFLFSSLASSLFLGYLVDASKGLLNVIRLGDVDLLKDIEGIAVFFFIPGLFSVMLPAYYLSRGIT